ncbi:UDP-glycosyltransferase 92A1-like [Aristolochia californica]|uniref:UDP-glycosyltransferase 92A1-like n=1 Tax=Aristolochia californica TaxID=171875 RepID=UPI0035DA26DD
MLKDKHLVLFPFMAEGHLIPFMALAGHIKKRTQCNITLVTTPLILQKLKAIAPSDSEIGLAELPFSCTDLGLALLEASETLQSAFENFISDLCETAGRDSVHIIADFLVGWAVEVAKKLGVLISIVMTSGAYGTAVAVSLWLQPPRGEVESDEFSLADFPRPLCIRRSELPDYLRFSDGTDFLCKFLQRQSSRCLGADGFLFNTVEGLEDIGLEYFRKKSGRHVWAIGPIISENDQRWCRREPGLQDHECVKWLDLRSPSSVLYIAFGSAETISAMQMMEFALGLELSGKPFIWVVKPPVGFEEAEQFRAEWLPEGFEDRIEKRKQGLLVKIWGPQLAILAHKSTGAFLSHCGWNSILESLAHGVPIISWPLAAEQHFNSKMLVEEIRVSIEIATGDSSKIDRAHVSSVIETAMGETEKGEEIRRNASKVRAMLEAATREEGCSIKALDDFINRAFPLMKSKAEEI